jgi:acid stress chaperone HdeB
MTKPRLVLAGLMLASLAAPAARAQVSLDVAKITCEQFILYKVSSPQNIAIWLSGYYNGKRGNTVIDPQALKENSDKVIDYCRANLAMPVMQAVENLFGAGK